MFKGIFDKSGAAKQGKGQGSAPAVASVGTQPAVPVAPLSTAPVPVDAAMLAISRELSGLARVPVAQAARERGWAALQRELESRPVVSTGAGSARPVRSARSRGWRWALASAAAAVAVIAALLGTYGGGLLQTADNGDQTTTVTSVVSTDTTGSSTTVSTDGTTVSTDGPVTTQTPGTTGVQPSTTQSPGTTGGTQPSTSTTGGSTPTTGGGGPTTTRPSSTSTTTQQQYTAAQREGSAWAAVQYLAELVITGNTSGARALVAPEAQGSLAQMMMSLSEPYGYKRTGLLSLSDTIVRVTIQINDRVMNPNGELEEALPKFVIKVRVDDKGAVITAINAG